MKKNLKIVFVAAIIMSFANNCFAGYPIGQGRWLLVPTYTRYESSSYWNRNGVSVSPTNPNDNFISNYFGLYGGTGVGRDVDLVFNIPYVNNVSTTSNITDGPLNTTGDITVGLAWFLNKYDYYKFLTLTTSIIIPGYNNIQTNLLPGFASVGAEVKLGLCGTNTTTLKNSYYDMEVGLRKYFNRGEPTQFFANATMGMPLDENQDWKITGILNYVNSFSNSTTTSSTTTNLNPFLNRDFSYLRAQTGIGRRITRNITLWATIFKDIAGTNIGQGSGFSIYSVIKF